MTTEVEGVRQDRPPRERRILVVDDNDANRYAVKLWLEQAGFTVFEARNGRETLERARESPDLIVLDIGLPDINGLDLLRLLKAGDRTQSIPMLHLTASYTSGDWRAEGLEAGADGYLTHPVEPRELIATVRALLRLYEAEQQVRTAANEWQAAFDSLSEAVFLLDRARVVVRCNRAAAALLGLPFPRIIGRALTDLTDSWLDGEKRALDAAIEQSQRDRRSTQGDLHVDGRAYAFTADVVPDLDDGGENGVVCVLTDVTERVALLEREQELHRQADSASRAKSDFLAIMSHEIRTPLNAISGYAQLLDLEVAGPLTETQRQYLSRLQLSTTHLLGLINDILEIARVDAGGVRISKEEVLVDDVIDGAIALIQPQAAEKRIEIGVTRPDGEGLRLLGDADRVRQIVVNLLSNAVKFTAAGGRVTVDSGTEEFTGRRTDELSVRSLVFVRVDDTGIGIPEELHSAIFDPFVQGEQGKTRSKGGTGLGLTISRRLARLMGGDLTMRSAAGEGSSFKLTLPAAGAAEGLEVAAMEHAQSAAPVGLTPLSRHLRSESDHIVDHFIDRIRRDPVLRERTASLSEGEAQDHVHSFLADLWQSLAVLDEAGGIARDAVVDSTDIQRHIAGRHGAQRARLRFNRAQLEREFEVLETEITDAAHRHPAGDDEAFSAGLRVITQLMDSARRASVSAHQRALNVLPD